MAKKTKYRDEDLFKDSTMTFGEHLEELRGCLVKSILWLMAALVIVVLPQVNGAERIVNLIQDPLKRALGRYYLTYTTKRLEPQLQALALEGIPAPDYHRIVDAVTKDQVIPSLQLMDVRETLMVLGQKHKLPLGEELVQGFSAADFVDHQRFCRELLHDKDLPQYGQQPEHPAKSLWAQLPQTAKDLVTRCASGEPLDLKQQRQLAEHVSAALSDEKFLEANQAYFDVIQSYEAPWWSWFDFKGDIKEQVAKANRLKELRRDLSTPQQSRELNRHLLATLYPESIAAGPRKTGMVAVPFFQRVEDDPRLNLKSLNAQEMFMIWIKAALLLSLVIASPAVFYHLWSFVAAGLHPNEKRYVYLYMPMSILLFLSGVVLCFRFVLPFVLDFLFIFNESMNVDPDVRISEWFGFALFLPLGFGLAFQLPLVMLFLERIGVMTVASYVSRWRMAILIITITSALLTPGGDPYSILFMAVPLVFLYFGAILLCKYMPKGRNPFEDES